LGDLLTSRYFGEGGKMIEPVFSSSDHLPLARSPFGGGIVIHATGEQTSGAFGIWETIVAPGTGPAPHTHT
jgi:hypothetical protein